MTDDVERLKKAVRDFHDLEATPVRSDDVRETFQGAVAWDGTAHVFRVYGHPKAQHAYAWSLENDAGNRENVAVLGIPPVNSPQDAVRAAIAAEHVRRKGSR